MASDERQNKINISDFFKDYISHSKQIYLTYPAGRYQKFAKNSYSFYEKRVDGYSKNEENNLKHVLKKLNNKQKKIEYAVKAISSAFNIELDLQNIERNDFYNVISGMGNEYKKIRTLHSSGLCGFLHFWKINQGHKIKIPKKYFDKSCRTDEYLEFDQVKFEFESECVGKNSSFDVLLINKKTKNIMFVELKFSEYFNDSPYYPSIKYIDDSSQIYQTLFSNDNSLMNESDVLLQIKYPVDHNENGKVVKSIEIFNSNNHKIYTGGVKQLISHSIAMKKYREKIINEKDKDMFVPDNIYYLELAFNLEGSNLNKKCDGTYLGEFNLAYKVITDKINKMEGFKKIKYADRVYTYQELFNSYENMKLLNSETQKFYKYI